MQTTSQPMADYSQFDDARLAKEANRNADAFTELYRRYVTPLYRYLFHRLGNEKDVEDLTAQVFMDALESLAAYRERGYFSAWLFTIARRRLADLYRQRPTSPLHESLPDGFDLQTILDQNENRARLNQLLNELDDERRELIQLRFAAGLEFSEIASALGKSEGAVKMTLYRTLDWLKANWEVAHE